MGRNGTCLRCADGMFADEDGVCQGLKASSLTPSVRRELPDLRRRCVVVQVVRRGGGDVPVERGVPQQRGPRGEVPRVPRDGRVRRVQPRFFRDDKPCAACPADCATCLVAEMCLTCNDTHFMTVSWT